MTYLIIGIAIIFIIAPIFAILPSTKQKSQMKLRQSAMAQGVRVELTTIQDPIPRQDKYLSNTGKPLPPVLSVAAYRKVRPKPAQWRLAPRLDWVVEKREVLSKSLTGNWCWSPEKPSTISDEFESLLRAQLDTLPVDVVKIEEINYFLSVYWHESSGEEGLSAIVRFLDACTALSPNKTVDQPGSD
jgi:hypothetical protein